MKNCTPLEACASVSCVGSVGLLAIVPAAVDEKVPVCVSTAIDEVTSLLDAGRSGVRKYRYSVIVKSSRYSPVGPLSKSYTVIATRSFEGSSSSASMPKHE